MMCDLEMASKGTKGFPHLRATHFLQKATQAPWAME
jgi:hypothetical protein